MTLWATPVVLIGCLLLFAGARGWLARRFPKDATDLVDAVDALLPQTQCAQCGYPGCRPYAEAVVQGAPLNLCPPGGVEVHQALGELLGNSEAGAPPATPPAMRAVIDEARCIGCALCLPACPVDAIVGAANQMHTVIEADCTGCELCVAPCPVDCISMIDLPEPVPALKPRHVRAVSQPQSTQGPCIACGRCEPVCPVDLPAMTLLQLVQRGQIDDAAEAGLDACIDCSLCDAACPSLIPMARQFALAKEHLRLAAETTQQQAHFKARYEAHVIRLEQAEQDKQRKREQRLSRKRSWQ